MGILFLPVSSPIPSLFFFFSLHHPRRYYRLDARFISPKSSTPFCHCFKPPNNHCYLAWLSFPRLRKHYDLNPSPPFYAACLGEPSFSTLHAFSHSEPFNRVLPIHLDTTFIQPFLQDLKCFSLPFFSPTLNWPFCIWSHCMSLVTFKSIFDGFQKWEKCEEK